MNRPIDSDNLKPLFNAVLRYEDSADDVDLAENLPGSYIGRGLGTVEGDRINGQFVWKLHAENCAFLWLKEGSIPPPDMHLCNTYFSAIISTNDGAEISFSARGFGFRGALPESLHLWSLTASLRFGTEDKRYSYLNKVLGIWEGTFNEEKREAFYHAYLSTPG